jgi:hypothetical protein
MQMDLVIYEDTTRLDAWTRLIIFFPSSLLLAAAIFIPPDDQAIALFMIPVAIIVAGIIFCVIPVKYCILDSKIRIIFRGSLNFDIPYETVVTVRPPRWSTIGINLPSNMSQANAVEIVRRKKLAVAITPTDRTVFLRYFEEAFSKWQTYGRQTQ